MFTHKLESAHGS